MDEIKIGTVIKRLLREQKRTLKEVSRETGIPYSTLHTWQENRQPKDIVKARRLAKHLGISFCQLLFDLEDPLDRKESTQMEQRLNEIFKGSFEIVIRKVDKTDGGRT